LITDPATWMRPIIPLGHGRTDTSSAALDALAPPPSRVCRPSRAGRDRCHERDDESRRQRRLCMLGDIRLPGPCTWSGSTS